MVSTDNFIGLGCKSTNWRAVFDFILFFYDAVNALVSNFSNKLIIISNKLINSEFDCSNALFDIFMSHPNLLNRFKSSEKYGGIKFVLLILLEIFDWCHIYRVDLPYKNHIFKCFSHIFTESSGTLSAARAPPAQRLTREGSQPARGVSEWKLAQK